MDKVHGELTGRRSQVQRRFLRYFLSGFALALTFAAYGQDIRPGERVVFDAENYCTVTSDHYTSNSWGMVWIDLMVDGTAKSYGANKDEFGTSIEAIVYLSKYDVWIISGGHLMDKAVLLNTRTLTKKRQYMGTDFILSPDAKHIAFATFVYTPRDTVHVFVDQTLIYPVYKRGFLSLDGEPRIAAGKSVARQLRQARFKTAELASPLVWRNNADLEFELNLTDTADGRLLKKAMLCKLGAGNELEVFAWDAKEDKQISGTPQMTIPSLLTSAPVSQRTNKEVQPPANAKRIFEDEAVK